MINPCMILKILSDEALRRDKLFAKPMSKYDQHHFTANTVSFVKESLNFIHLL